MNMVLKSMREATPSETACSTASNEKVYTSMLDQQLAQNLSGRGVGPGRGDVRAARSRNAPAGAPEAAAGAMSARRRRRASR